MVAPVRRSHARPTTYRWSPAGELVLNVSVPSGPSPVISVPKAIADILEGRALPLSTPRRTRTPSLPSAIPRRGGSGRCLVVAGLTPGQRFDLTCDLIAGTATLTPETTEASA